MTDAAAGPVLDDEIREAIRRYFRLLQSDPTADDMRAEAVTDGELLREVMNTVGKPGRLGEGVRCVVSVSMLTEGWDANTVTHVLGVRALDLIETAAILEPRQLQDAQGDAVAAPNPLTGAF